MKFLNRNFKLRENATDEIKSDSFYISLRDFVSIIDISIFFNLYVYIQALTGLVNFWEYSSEFNYL